MFIQPKSHYIFEDTKMETKIVNGNRGTRKSDMSSSFIDKTSADNFYSLAKRTMFIFYDDFSSS